MATKRTSSVRAALALLVGATLGASWTTFGYLDGMIKVNGFSYFQQWGFKNGTVVFVMSFLCWLAGLVVIAGPSWALARWRGWLNWHHALIAGFALPSVASLVLTTRFFTGRSSDQFTFGVSEGRIWDNGVLTAIGWEEAWRGSFEFGVLGALITIACWFVVYGGKQADSANARSS